MSTPFPASLQAAAASGDSAAVLDAALAHFGCQAGTVHLLREREWAVPVGSATID